MDKSYNTDHIPCSKTLSQNQYIRIANLLLHNFNELKGESVISLDLYLIYINRIEIFKIK